MLVELKSLPSVKDSLLLGLISSEAFRGDQLSELMSPPKFRFGNLDKQIALIADPAAKLAYIERLAKAWTHYVKLYAWAWYGELSRGGFRVFLWYDEHNVPVGLAIWSLPYPLRPKRSLFEQIWAAIRRLRARINIAWIQLWYPGLNPRALPRTAHFFHDMEEEMEVAHTPERERQLLAMSDAERAKTGLTVDLSYYLRFFAVSTPGKGHGSRMFKAIDLQAQPFVVRNVRIEPKLTIIASPMGMGLYKKFGFHSIAAVSRDFNGETLVREFMVLP